MATPPARWRDCWTASAEAGRRLHIERKFGLPQHSKTLSNSLHHAVLNAVVHHFDEMPGTMTLKKLVTASRRHIGKQIFPTFKISPLAANHQAGAVSRAGRATRRAAVQKH